MTGSMFLEQEGRARAEPTMLVRLFPCTTHCSKAGPGGGTAFHVFPALLTEPQGPHELESHKSHKCDDLHAELPLLHPCPGQLTSPPASSHYRGLANLPRNSKTQNSHLLSQFHLVREPSPGPRLTLCHSGAALPWRGGQEGPTVIPPAREHYRLWEGYKKAEDNRNPQPGKVTLLSFRAEQRAFPTQKAGQGWMAYGSAKPTCKRKATQKFMFGFHQPC